LSSTELIRHRDTDLDVVCWFRMRARLSSTCP